MEINWRVRIKNKTFWLAIIPACLLFIQWILSLFGVPFDATTWSAKLVEGVDLFFLILVIIGVVADPTTDGIGDSQQALTYEQPKKDYR